MGTAEMHEGLSLPLTNEQEIGRLEELMEKGLRTWISNDTLFYVLPLALTDISFNICYAIQSS